MICRLPPLLLLGLALAAPAAAQGLPTAGDAHIREQVYRPDAVLSVTGALRTASQIIFPPGETIQHVALGDGEGWEVAAEGSAVFLKPRSAQAQTNLLVVTQGSAGPRYYAFRLRVGSAATADYQVRLSAPADPDAAASAALSQARDVAERRLIALALEGAPFEGPRNLAYSVQGDADLQPEDVSDNGRFTVLRFAAGRDLPAVFEVAEDGAERIVPFDIRGDFIVIHSLVRGLRLRRGDRVLCIYNEAFRRLARPSSTGTASDVVERRPEGGDA